MRRKRCESVREGMEMSKKIVKANISVLRISIQEKQKAVSGDLAAYRDAAKNIKIAAKNYKAADKAYAKKGSSKNARRCNDAQAELWDCIADFKNVGQSITDTLEDIILTVSYA